MLRTDVVSLSVIKGIAYRQKLPSGGSGLVIVREDAAQPGIASISKTSGEAIPAANTPKDLYPPEAFGEAARLTAGLPYKKQGGVRPGGFPDEPSPGESAADSPEYLAVVKRYTDLNGRLSGRLINRDMIKFSHASSVVRRLKAEGRGPEEIGRYVFMMKFRDITGNAGLEEDEAQKMADLLDEASDGDLFGEFFEDILHSPRGRGK